MILDVVTGEDAVSGGATPADETIAAGMVRRSGDGIAARCGVTTAAGNVNITGDKAQKYIKHWGNFPFPRLPSPDGPAALDPHGTSKALGR